MNTANQPSGNEDRVAREVLAFSRHESHPEPGVLAAYHARRLAEGEAEAIQDHLAECRHCAELVLDLEELMGEEEAESSAGPVPPPEIPMQPRAPQPFTLEPAPRLKELSAKREGRSDWRRFARSPWLQVAAVLLLSVSAYQGGRWSGVKGAVRQARAPQAIPPAKTLLPSGSLRSVGDRDVISVQLPAELSFRFPSEARGATVVFEFREMSGRLLWKVAGGPIRMTNETPLFVPLDSLPPGRYVVQATTKKDGGAKGSETFHLRVLPP